MTAVSVPDAREMRALARSLLKAAEVVQDASRPEPFLKMSDILTWVALDFGFRPEVLRGASRRADFFRARAEAMRQMHDEYGYSLPRIGRYFFRDHTTVLHAVRRARARKELGGNE